MTFLIALWLAFLAIVFNIAAQFLLKKTATNSTIKEFNYESIYNYLLQSMFSLTFIAGIASAFLASVLYLISLNKLPLSVAFPFTGFSFIAIFLIGIFIFDEKLNLLNSIGLILMLIGIFLITYPSS
jgi:multidrug transporter EmrE-like cation transporter